MALRIFKDWSPSPCFSLGGKKRREICLVFCGNRARSAISRQTLSPSWYVRRRLSPRDACQCIHHKVDGTVPSSSIDSPEAGLRTVAFSVTFFSCLMLDVTRLSRSTGSDRTCKSSLAGAKIEHISDMASSLTSLITVAASRDFVISLSFCVTKRVKPPMA